MDISVLSNINVDSLIKRLSKNNNVLETEGYGNILLQLSNDESIFNIGEVRAVFLLIDGEEVVKNICSIEKMKEEIDIWFKIFEENIKKKTKTIYFVSTIDLPHKALKTLKEVRYERIIESYWYEKLVELNEKFSNFYIFDIKEIIEQIGRDKFYSKKLWYLGNIKYSSLSEKIIKNRIEQILKSIEGKRKKGIVLDLDNTLWGGVVGEEGIEGVALSEDKEGLIYKEFQNRLKELKNMGIILNIASKNNPYDALELINNHKHMILRQNDFSNLKINWNIKSQNIKLITEELNLGLDSLVFIDDNPFEREIVKSEVEGIIVPDYPEHIEKLNDFIKDVYYEYFLTLDVTEEDRKKTVYYNQNKQRAVLKKESISYEEFLKSLDMKVTVEKGNEKHVKRLSQLVNKTNQFNLRTKRYDEIDIRKIINDLNKYIYIIRVEDKFGDSGYVSCVICEKIDNETVFMDTFLISCRVMGRYIENYMMDFIEEEMKNEGFQYILGEYIETKKNIPVKDFYESLGYKIVSEENESKKYVLDLNKKESRKYFVE